MAKKFITKPLSTSPVAHSSKEPPKENVDVDVVDAVDNASYIPSATAMDVSFHGKYRLSQDLFESLWLLFRD